MRKRAFIIIFLQSAVLLTLIASILYRLIPPPRDCTKTFFHESLISKSCILPSNVDPHI